MREIDYKIGKKIDIKNTKDFTRAHDVYVYIAYKGKRKYFNTLVKCKLRNFDGERVVGLPDAKLLNQQIEDTIKEAMRLIQAVIDQYDYFDLSLIDKVEADETKSLDDDFVSWVETEMPTSNLTEGTIRNNSATIRLLKEFKKIKSLFDINKRNIELFDAFLRGKGYTYDTVHKHHSKLRSFIRKSIIAGYNIKDPYILFKVKRPKPSKIKYIDEEDLQKILDFRPKNKTLQKVRDLFIFQAMTGLSYADAVKVSKTDIKVIQGKKYIIDKRQKTLQEYSVRIYPESEVILKRYNYDMNLLTNQSYNRLLKSMAITLGIREDLSSHMARHTFATVALNRGVPLAIVAKMLGHSTTKCTEIYAQYLQSTIQREGYDKLEDIFG